MGNLSKGKDRTYIKADLTSGPENVEVNLGQIQEGEDGAVTESLIVGVVESRHAKLRLPALGVFERTPDPGVCHLDRLAIVAIDVDISAVLGEEPLLQVSGLGEIQLHSGGGLGGDGDRVLRSPLGSIADGLPGVKSGPTRSHPASTRKLGPKPPPRAGWV